MQPTFVDEGMSCLESMSQLYIDEETIGANEAVSGTVECKNETSGLSKLT
jgi:hypothetical protein